MLMIVQRHCPLRMVSDRKERQELQDLVKDWQVDPMQRLPNFMGGSKREEVLRRIGLIRAADAKVSGAMLRR